MTRIITDIQKHFDCSGLSPVKRCVYTNGSNPSSSSFVSSVFYDRTDAYCVRKLQLTGVYYCSSSILTINCFQTLGESVSSLLWPRRIHVTPYTYIPQRKVSADLETTSLDPRVTIMWPRISENWFNPWSSFKHQPMSTSRFWSLEKARGSEYRGNLVPRALRENPWERGWIPRGLKTGVPDVRRG